MKALFKRLASFALPVVLAASGITAAAGPAAAAEPAHGTLLSAQPAALQLGQGAPAVSSWRITYASTDSHDTADTVSGTVIVPLAGWSGGGARPIVSYAPGTHGLAQKCAPSRQLAAGTDYETANLVALLEKGYAVAVTDYAGYLGDASTVPPYLAGRSEGHAVLDAALAAPQISGSGLSTGAKVGVWGYSQGGQAAAWAGQLQPAYASGLDLAGVAAGGIPGDFKASARYLNAATGSSFLLAGVAGLAAEYPDAIPFDRLANDAGKAAVADARTKCVFETLFPYMNKDIKDYTADGQTLEQLMALPTVSPVLDAQDLGGSRIGVPVYDYHGRSDEILPLNQAWNLKKRYCAQGTNVKFDLYPGDHIATQFQGAAKAVDWLGDRFAGVPQLLNDCWRLIAPSSTANPGGGNFVVSLDKWDLTGPVHVAGALDEDMYLPDGSTFSADTDLTAKTLSGGLDVPSWQEHVTVAGLPADTRITLRSEGTSGTVSLDGAGQLHLRGTARATIEIGSVGEGPIQLPAGCKTADPVSFPLSFDGPVSALGDGGLRFSGTTTFPKLTDCGLWGPALSLIFSGPGNGYDFTVAPPAPRAA